VNGFKSLVVGTAASKMKITLILFEFQRSVMTLDLLIQAPARLNTTTSRLPQGPY
jgi:hypothetical protein